MSYRCAGCDTPAQQGHSQQCPTMCQRNENCEAPFCHCSLAELNEERINIASGEDVCLS